MPNKPEFHSDSPTTAGPGRRTLASRASALLVTLLLLTIVTTIVVLMFQAVTIDRRLAADFQKGVQARAISQFALDDALQTLQSALNNLDDPFGATTAATNFWAVAPGRLDLFSLASGNSRPLRTSTIALHSGYDTSQELVDLNFTNASGTRAIWPGGQEMPVNWKPVLKNPSSAASAANPAVGRYAFWVDDESSKVNINTADGTELYTTNSYGLGTPSSVRLGAILTNLSTNQIKAIAAAAITNQFSDISEVGRLDTNALAAVRSNAFFLTEYSRSPEFNIFNEPRFQLASMWGGNRASNGITGNGTVGTPTNFIPSTAPRRQPLDFRLSHYPVGSSTTTPNFPARSIYPAPLQLTNTNFSSFWPYMPMKDPGYVFTINQNPNLNYLAGTVASISQITNNVGSTNNYLFRSGNGPSGTIAFNSPERFEAARRLGLYLTGTNANYKTISWPFAQPNYTTKYSLSQIDSIVIQTLDRVNLVLNNDASTLATSFTIPPLLAPYGILGTNPVIGQGTSPKLCELLFDFSYTPKDVGVGYDDGAEIFIRYYRKALTPGHYLNPAAIMTNFPRSSQPTYGPGMLGKDGSISGNLGVANLNPYDAYPVGSGQIDSAWPRPTSGSGSSAVVPPFMSYPSFPAQTLAGTTYPGGGSYYPNPWVLNPSISTNTANPYGSQWGDTLLQALDQNGLCAGLDFNLRPIQAPDPDPRAPYFRRNTNGTFSSTVSRHVFTNSGTTYNKWWGSIWGIESRSMNNPIHAGYLDRSAGLYRQRPGFYVTQNGWGTVGGVSLRTRHTWNTNTTPPTLLITNTLLGLDANYTNAVTSVTFRGGVNYMATLFRAGLPVLGVMEIVPLSMVRAIPMLGTGLAITTNLPFTNSVIPFPSGVTISEGTPNQYVWAYVEDPMVNKFPGDWIVTRSTTMPSHTLGLPAISSTNDFKTNANIAANRDLASFWGPMSPYEYGVNSMLNLPSIGSLQYIRTKMIPDDSGPNTNRGIPFRCLSFAGVSDSTQTDIPDWAMLDLMTVPQAVYDRPGNIILSGATNVINLTYGGATTGKLNPNGSAIFPWVTNSPTYIRPQPLIAVFTDLRYNLNGTTNFLTNSFSNASTLASNVATYIAANGPLAMAGQICDIPAINAYGATVNPTRNDIVSQSIGLLETRSSVFSVWVAAQSFTKKPGNTGYGSFETGDNIQAEKRYRFTVERYLDLGVDGVPGNANSPGPDNVVGTLDDDVDAVYNPPNPKFKYRIINAQEIL